MQLKIKCKRFKYRRGFSGDETDRNFKLLPCEILVNDEKFRVYFNVIPASRAL